MLQKFRKGVLTPYEEKKLEEAIRSAEGKSTGRLFVHVDEYCKTHPVFKAQNVFEHLGLSELQVRHAVLIYMAMKERKLAVVGDAEVNGKMPIGFWEEVKAAMLDKAARDGGFQALLAGVEKVGVGFNDFFTLQTEEDAG